MGRPRKITSESWRALRRFDRLSLSRGVCPYARVREMELSDEARLPSPPETLRLALVF